MTEPTEPALLARRGSPPSARPFAVARRHITREAAAADGPRHEPHECYGEWSHARRQSAAVGGGRAPDDAQGVVGGLIARVGGDHPGGPDGGRDFAVRVGLGVLVLGLGYFVVCVVGRLGSPWPLEWMEGASALHAQRLVRGLPLYAAPRAEFIPFVYPPLSYLPMGLGLLVSGGALWGARLSSVVATLASCIALWRAGRHVSGTHAGLLAAGLFAMGYGYTGGFIDLARVDAWFCALSLCAVERLCARRYTQGLLVLALACLTKQHAVLLLAAASGGLWFVHGRSSVRAIIASWLALAASIAAICALSDGWFWTYCVTVPARHGVEPSLLISFVLVDLCLYLPLLIGLCGYFVATRRDPASHVLSLLLLAAVVASALGRAHPGGDDNVRLPAYALVSLVAAVSFCDLVVSRPRLRLPLMAALVLQLAMLFQPPALYWPSQQASRSFAQLRAELERCAGSNDFAAMDHVGLGDHAFVHTLALSDLRMNQDELAAQATEATLSVLRGPANRAPRVLAISSAFPGLMQALAEHYALCARTPAIALPTGYKLSETFIYRRRLP